MGIILRWMTLLGPMARGTLVHIAIPNSWVGPTELVGVGPLKETDAQTTQVRLEDMGSREYHWIQRESPVVHQSVLVKYQALGKLSNVYYTKSDDLAVKDGPTIVSRMIVSLKHSVGIKRSLTISGVSFCTEWQHPLLTFVVDLK
jgi:hypothetical protein